MQDNAESSVATGAKVPPSAGDDATPDAGEVEAATPGGEEIAGSSDGSEKQSSGDEESSGTEE